MTSIGERRSSARTSVRPTSTNADPLAFDRFNVDDQ